jgi:hypothetical protein
VYFENQPGGDHRPKLLTKDEARRVADRTSVHVDNALGIGRNRK